MPGVPRELIEHELHVDPNASFIKEVHHPYWLTNPVLVPKKNKDWRMCVDYTDINKAYKKDPFGPKSIKVGLHDRM
jgi:hypothetical protein